MSEKFSPSFLMKNKHIQTLYQTFFRKIQTPEYEIEKFTLEDGDFLDAYWHKTKSDNSSSPIVVIFHGLAGSYKSPYIIGIMKSLAKSGYNTVLMHFRGCSGKPNIFPRSYHSGETGDGRYFIQSLHKRFPDAKLFGIGYSLGGNMLLKLLGEDKENALLDAAVSISPPMQLDICANAINKGISKIYQKRLVNDLNRGLLKKFTVNNMQSHIGISENQVKKLKTFWEFDGVYTAPIHGFESAQDYYTQCSSRQFLKDIHIPTLILHSKDDPFMDTSIIPSEKELSRSVTLELSENGGHVGFIEGSFFKPKYWLEKRVIEFFKNYLP